MKQDERKKKILNDVIDNIYTLLYEADLNISIINYIEGKEIIPYGKLESLIKDVEELQI